MKTLFLLPALLALIPACASAQVSVNSAALQQLQGIAPQAPVEQAPVPVAAAAVTPLPRKPHPHHHTAKPAPPNAAKPGPGAAQTGPTAASMPAATPPKPAAPAQPAPAAPPAAPAIPSLAKIEFAPGSATLPANAADTLKPFCAATSEVPVVTYAPADNSDPSAAMRLSMARAFAIRDALTACGVKPQYVIPRASGPKPGADDNEALIGASAKP